MWTPAGDSVPTALTTIDVRTAELDSFGHVNHAVYLNYLEHSRFQALKEAGFSWVVLDERNWAIFVVETRGRLSGRGQERGQTAACGRGPTPSAAPA